MSQDADYLYALEMQKRLNAVDEEGDSDIEEVDFKKPSPTIVVSKKPLQIKRSNPRSNLDEDFLNRTQNLVHPQWETLDPTPDIKALFGQFDGKFFQSRLKCVTLEWSKRMYSCAGICYSRRNRFGMDITIRLSQPLLSLRPRKDLVETMLHEMIHAYCFVLNIREGNGGHGPNFKKIMGSINKVAGTNITVYHTFHDEVALYKQHWWRCNGMCQDRSPFFGYVKRTSNRAPGPNDQWWAQHMQSCGGTFMKIKEPEKKKTGKAAKGKENDKKESASATGSTDLRKFFTPQTKNTTIPKAGSTTTPSNIRGFNNFNNGFKGPVKTNGGGTMLLNPKTKSATTNTANKPPATSWIAKELPPSSYPGLSSDPFNVSLPSRNTTTSRGAIVPPGGNLRNVMSFKDFGGLGAGSGGNGSSGRPVSGSKSTTPNREDWGRGTSLSTSSSSSYGAGNTSVSSSPEGKVDRKHLRDIWAKRFGGGDDGSSEGNGIGKNGDFGEKRLNNEKPTGDSKRRRISNDGDVVFVADENATTASDNKNDWCIIDDDIMWQEKPNKVITLSSDEDDDDNENVTKPKINKNMTLDQRQTMIKQEIMDESINLCDDDIELIDDEYDDNVDLTVAAELADTSIIDEFFGEDTMMEDFKRENDCMPSSSRHQFDDGYDIITCPICVEKMTRSQLAEHLNGCTGIAVKILPRKKVMNKLATTSKEVKPTKRSRSTKRSKKDILRDAGYSEADLANIASSSSMEEDEEEAEFLNRSGIRRSNGNSSSTSGSTTAIQDLGSSPEDENTRLYRRRNIYKTTIQCPVCAREIEESRMNDHLDECLSK